MLLFLATCIGSTPVLARLDYEEAYKAYDKAKEVGHDATALKHILPLAEDGTPFPQFLVGRIYESGKGVPQDYAEAVRWYRKAAEQGSVRAQFSLGFAYDHGNGVPKDPVAAASWYQKAADREYTLDLGDNVSILMSQLNLGILYVSGRQGVPKDSVKAAHWWRKAAEKGEARAQFFLGSAYFRGDGVPQDYVEAYVWSNLAAARIEEKDRAEAINPSRLIAERMTAAQIAEAQKLAREWDAKHDRKSFL